ncbi:hypothetical protein V5799_024478, partial [Amblyomma americanum]
PDNAQHGDVLVLTKPLGTQVAVNVHQWREKPERRAQLGKAGISEEDVRRVYVRAVDCMARLNLNGSVLDGDEYSVLWYEDLIFNNNCNPMHYYSDPPKDRKAPIGVQDMVDFFFQYIKGVKIGLISNAHLVWVDILDSSINSHRCRELACKCAVNLDFAKCGDLKGLQNSEKPPMYPDFMENLDTKNTYCSRKVLGQLYRNCKKVYFSVCQLLAQATAVALMAKTAELYEKLCLRGECSS